MIEFKMLGIIGGLFGSYICSSKWVQDGGRDRVRQIGHQFSDQLPKNHDVARAVVSSAAIALDKIVDNLARNSDGKLSDIELQTIHSFQFQLNTWTREWAGSPNEELETEAVETLKQGITATLSTGAEGEPGADWADEKRAAVIKTVRDLVIEHTDPPTLFLDRFDGKNWPYSFFHYFAELVADALKENDAFRNTFIASELVEARHQLINIHSDLGLIDRRRRSESAKDAGLEWVDQVLHVPPVRKARPSAMVLAQHRRVRFLDFDGRLKALIEWALYDTIEEADIKRSIRGRLYTGDGGVGKTRLALELAQELDDRGWEIVRVRQTADPGTVWRAIEGDPKSGAEPEGLLIILDYAETRPDVLTSIAAAACAGEDRPGRPIRILALSRQAGAWWSETYNGQSTMAMFERAPQDLSVAQTSLSPDQRQALFKAAHSEFQSELEKFDLAGTANHQPDLLAPGFARPLAILFAAYLSARGETVTTSLNLIREMLGEEKNSWTRYFAAKGAAQDRDRRDMLARALCQVTLCQGAPEPLVKSLIAADTFFGERTPNMISRTLRDLRQFYPGAEADLIGGLEPDILGEALIGDMLETGDGADLVTKTVRSIFEQDEARTGPGQSVAQVFIRGTQNPDLRVVGAFETFLKRLCRNVEQGDFDGPALSALEAVMPTYSVALGGLKLSLAERALALAGSEMSEAERARVLRNLGVRSSDLGRREAALAATEEAVEMYRALAAKNPDAFRPDLASSLYVLGNILVTLERTDEAVDAYSEAAALLLPFYQSFRDAMSGLYSANLRHLVRALELKGDSSLAIRNHLTSLGVPEEMIETALAGLS